MTDQEKNAILNNVQRQYIGARYVPKFFQGPDGTPEWVGQVPYEALTIVTYLGNSYTSKIPVPVGIGNPSLNPTYWALTGNYNQQVEEYRSQVDILSKTVIKKENNKRNRSIVLIGDSYTTEAPPNTMFNAFTGPYMGNNTVYSKGEGGSGLLNKGINGNTFIMLLSALAQEISNKESITDVILIGGYNDKGYAATDIINAAMAFSSEVFKQFPNCTFYYTVPSSNYQNQDVRLQIKNVVLPSYSTGFSKRAFYLNTQNILRKKEHFSGEGLFHPSALGYSLLNTSLFNQFFGGMKKISLANQDILLTPVVSQGFIKAIYSEDFTSLYFPANFTLTFNESISIATESHIVLSESTTFLLSGSSISFPVFVNINNKHYHAFLRVMNTIDLLFYDPEVNGVTTNTISFGGGVFNIPSIIK